MFNYDNNSFLSSSYDVTQNTHTYYHYLDENHLDYTETSNGFCTFYYYDEMGNVTKRACFLADKKTENTLSKNKITSENCVVSYQNDLGNRITAENIKFNGKEIYENKFDYLVGQPEVNESITEEEFNKLIDVIPDSLIGSNVLPLDGLNIWNAFHETAQLVACKQLSNEGYLTDVEYPIKNGSSYLEADVLAYRGVNHLYEVKKSYESQGNAETQLNKYCSLTRFIPGNGFSSKEIDFLGSFFMNVFYSGNGIIRYRFRKKWSAKLFWYNVEVKKDIKEEDFKRALCVATWAGLITASAIILSTIIEDFITCGVGVADDSASIVAAAQSYSSSVGALAFCLV